MDSNSSKEVSDADSKSISNFLHTKISNGEKCMIEPSIITAMLTRLDIDLAYSSEKVLNLDLYITIWSLGENGFGGLSRKKNISEVEILEALLFDLLFGYLDSEVTELGHFLNVVGTKIADANKKINSCRQRRDIFNILHDKLHVSESSWKHLQEKLLEMKQQLANLDKTFSVSGFNSTYPDENIESLAFDLQIPEQQRFVLRMLEKSIASQLDLEKQLLESKEREEELKMKLVFTNEVISNTEAFTEVVLERVLEAEHSSVIYMGIGTGLISRLQILQFNLQCSCHREETSAEKVKVLGEKLREAKASYEASKEQLSVMENEVESLREDVLMAESRACNVDSELTRLTEENMELREEVGFLKGGRSNNEEKISLLEKQVRELETRLQTARTHSEASLEQQNMLYMAIWDMETLIEELKSKVSKAESRAENAEEQCLVLAENNLELNKEVSILKSERENLEESAKGAENGKVAWVKDVSNGAKLITDMVMQLAIERESIQKQLSSLSRENKILLEELQKMRNGTKTKQDNKEEDGKKFSSIVDSIPNRIRESPASETPSYQSTTSLLGYWHQFTEMSEALEKKDASIGKRDQRISRLEEDLAQATEGKRKSDEELQATRLEIDCLRGHALDLEARGYDRFRSRLRRALPHFDPTTK